MSDETKDQHQPSPTVRVIGLGDLGFFLFLSVCVATCGWAPNCADDAKVETDR